MRNYGQKASGYLTAYDAVLLRRSLLHSLIRGIGLLPLRICVRSH